MSIEDYIEGIRDNLDEIENLLDDSDDTRIDLDDFIEELKKDKLYTKEMEEFIEHYKKYHNN